MIMGVLSILLAVLRTAALIILILVIMLIILAALLLFSPIGYRLRGSFADEQPDGTARFSAFFGVLKGEISYHHGAAVSGELRLFGIRIYNIEGSPEDALRSFKEDEDDR